MRVAINGFGRIGRLVFKLMMMDNDIDVVAVNDLTDERQLAYLLKYDTNYGNYKINSVNHDDGCIYVDDKKILVYQEKDPSSLPWKDLDIDIVFECTGKFTKEEDARLHIKAGAKKVLISAPAKGNVKTVVYNVNDDILDGSEEIISAASCTTNCLAPVLKIIDDNFGINKGFMTTIHAFTNDQVILDVAHKKDINERRCRAGALNIIPTSTGAATAIGKVLPNLDGRLDGSAIRVPVGTGSLIDLTLDLNKRVTKEQVNMAFISNKNETISITYDPIVSSDIIGSKYGALVDGLLTKVETVDDDQLVKIIAWYDNELGYSAQMLRLAKKICEMSK